MNWLRELGRRIRMLMHRRQFDADLEAEMRLHLEMREQEHLESGMKADDARAVARRRFGNPTYLKEESHIAWGWKWLENLAQDVHYGLRMLGRAPGFTVVAVLTLTLGIGANTTIFSVVDGVLLRPLPYQAPDRLMRLDEKNLPRMPHFSVAPANLLSWQEQGTSFEQIAAYTGWEVGLTGIGVPEQLQGARISSNLFSVLGVSPQLGRSFREDEEQPGRDQVVLISYGIWRRHFGRNPALVDRALILDGQSYTVIGIMPSGFQFPNGVEIWKPLGLSAADRANRGGHYLEVIGRLKPSVTPLQARAEMDTIAARLAQQYHEDEGW